jgi:hypothetical protein
METRKMSLANVQGKLSRAEMKNIMAGDGDGTCAKDGEDCPVFGECCNECKASFKCGKKSEAEPF